MHKTNPTSNPRQKRSVQLTRFKDDPRIWIDKIGVPRGVPNEEKAQNQIGAGFLSAPCPWCTMNINVDWINYIYYNQQRFSNYTFDLFESLGEQVHATSRMAWQNRMALDMMLAERGGVCTMFGDECCTFIPNNTSPGGSFTLALKKLQDLRDELKDNAGHGQWETNWFDKIGQWLGRLDIALISTVIALMIVGLCCISIFIYIYI